ncbi:type II toxin-antitoxin system ParD family antitoxin [Methylobacterium sp. NEAU 140]|uniref:type II toxin-antitoxin system ParD family antitoxin n=1 Tax=Methylobacterium sp. NEAU 140 TaxID=3064945 RepID=UPI0027354724|nr:type II toxin-antitoxin system ParD family antitoxin [Methylobacterium sp. NEAU 140]MDP4022749.1 type II toxin-antitoxin system ParD family antitoxin [Methylobacterium sp. NEAU 140]
MPHVDLDAHLDGFVREQIAQGRFRTVSEVVQAGLRLLEGRDADLAAHRDHLKRAITAAFDDPRPSIPVEEAFAQVRAHHAEQVEALRRGR